MKKYFQSIAYVAFLLVSIWALITAISSYKNPFSLYENPLVWILLVMLVLVILAKELLNVTIAKKAEELQFEKDGINPEEIDNWAWLKKIMKRFTKSRDIEENEEIILDHNYDGIRELDNVLPPWWVYLFYVTIAFAAIYLVRFEIMGDDDQFTEYNKAMAVAKREVEKFKASSPDTFDISTVTQLTDDADLNRGKAVFGLNCASCHAPDGGGGIGPNLTDKHWLLGGGFKNAFNTIYNGGRDGKGMVAWGKILKPQDIQKVASYVLSLQGTTPAKPKDPQGEIWVDADAKTEKTTEANETEATTNEESK